NEEPNNWESIFKGSAWEKCEKTDEYYLHLFSKKQPDLNWENEEMRKEIYNMMNWWLDKGIDGFRVDAISHIKKVDGFPDMPNPDGKKYVDSFDMHMNIDGIQKYLKELKEETFAKYDIVTVGEANGVDAENSDEWVGSENGKFNMIFQFEHLKLWDYEGDTEFCPKAYKDVLNKWQVALENKGWNALFIENHDIPRSTSTWGNDREYWLESAKSFATTYFLQKGTPFIYQGQEIGMTNTVFNSLSEFQDVKSVNEGKEKLEAGMCEKTVLEILSNTSRDNARTPMQWDDSLNAGFTTGKPWLKVNSNYKNINVQSQIKDENSIYNHYKKLISLKKNSKTLTHGEFKLVLEDDKHVFAYLRELDNERYLILSNLSENEKKLNLSEFNIKNEDIVLSNYKIIEKDLKEFIVRPFESVVYKI
ncbi:MAG: alpha-amylase family glycosyl hydrolase, partial [Sarcina sp.]